jgi:hypothetical protein
MRLRRKRTTIGATALGAALLLTISCGQGGNSPTAPESLPPPTGDGLLLFQDSGCACVNPPYDPIPIYVDGRQAGVLPIFGRLSVPVAAGQHTWSSTAADFGATTVLVPARATITLDIYTNISCTQGCGDNPPPPDP